MRQHINISRLNLARLQPTAYNVGGYLGYRIGCKYALIFATDISDEINLLSQFFKVIMLGPSSDENIHIDQAILSEAIVVSELSGTIENGLPRELVQAVSRGRISVIAEKHASESKTTAIQSLSHSLAHTGLRAEFIGSVSSENVGEDKAIAIVDNGSLLLNEANRTITSPPESFRVVAIMAVYNESDIIVHSIRKMLAQGVEVYLIDNWSTDGTYEVVCKELSSELVGLERFPPDGPSQSYDLYALLSRKSEIAKTLRADWFIHCDADEIRYSPWQDVPLREAVYRVDQEGYNAIDHTIVEFHPIDNGLRPGEDFEDYFRYFSFGEQEADFLQIKAWKNIGRQISLADSAGHEVIFDDRRTYPYKFLVKHYPIRSQKHGTRKVFHERRSRYIPSAVAKGWHVHYEAIPENHNFLIDVQKLIRFDVDKFYDSYMPQRLTGIGALFK
jgi:glycosyltransferase involved in cell wall biosynthesis